jgi:hypothetical protein
LEVLYVNQKATKQLRIKCQEWSKESLYIIDTFISCNPDRPQAVCGGGEHYGGDNGNGNEVSVLLNN